MTALSALGIGVLGVYFAWRQHQLNERQFRHELYDRRMDVYAAAKRMIGAIYRDGTISDEVLFEVSQATWESDFLLDAKVSAQLSEMYSQALKLQTLQTELGILPEGDKRTKAIQDAGAIKSWFFDQGAVLKTLFGRFLTLS